MPNTIPWLQNGGLLRESTLQIFGTIGKSPNAPKPYFLDQQKVSLSPHANRLLVGYGRGFVRRGR